MQHQVVCEFTSNARVRSRQLSVARQRVNFRTSNSGFFEDNQTLPYVELGRKEGTIDKSLIYVPCKSNSLFLFFHTYTFPHTHTQSFSHTHFLFSFFFFVSFIMNIGKSMSVIRSFGQKNFVSTNRFNKDYPIP